MGWRARLVDDRGDTRAVFVDVGADIAWFEVSLFAVAVLGAAVAGSGVGGCGHRISVLR